MTLRRLLPWALAAALALVFAGYVWPTPYRYVVADGERSETTARVNRFTGETWMIYQGAWVPVGRPAPPARP
jgi:hypothetical protein